MIVDKKIDLNIYKERDGEEPVASCCVPSLKAEPKTVASCCAPSPSCCSTEPGVNTENLKEASKTVADLDFNEWVSEYYLCAALDRQVLMDKRPGSYAVYAVKPDVASKTS